MTSTLESHRLRHARQALVAALRLSGGIEMAACLAVCLPSDWMRVGYEWLRLGQMPEAAVFGYLARSTSLLWAAHGAVVVFLTTDIDRFLPLVRFIGWLTLVMGAALLGIDAVERLPLWWTAVEGPIVLVMGAVFLAASRQLQRELSRSEP